jgi:hypothetical protein
MSKAAIFWLLPKKANQADLLRCLSYFLYGHKNIMTHSALSFFALEGHHIASFALTLNLI